MTGREFIRFITNRGIPLSCIATRLNCKLSTLQALEKSESVPRHYIMSFTKAYYHSLNENELAMLSA